MDNKLLAIDKIEKEIKNNGLTLSELFSGLSKKKSTLLNLTKETQKKFDSLYENLENQSLNEQQRGKVLEDLAFCMLFNDNLFECKRNCRTSTNEIDILVLWSICAKLSDLNKTFDYMGESFLCECKNYDKKISVTFVGKFYSLMKMSGAKFGVMFSVNGISGRGKWDAGKGLIKKIALKDNVYIIDFNKNDFNKVLSGNSNFFSIINDKYEELKNDVNFSNLITNHENEKCIMS